VLEMYAKRGGAFREVVIANAAHGPLIDQAEEFNKLFHAFIAGR